MKDKEIKFAEWLSQNHYVLYDIKLGICFWENENDVDSSENLFKKFKNETMKDTIVESVIEQFKQRSNVGINKYGVTLDRKDLSTLQWIQHAQEEAMDLILYLEKLKEYEKQTISTTANK
jgi:hypothetical protein